MVNEERHTEAGARKRCRACLSEIDARARRCPHCARWQSWLSPELVVLVAAPLMILVVCIPPWFVVGSFVRLVAPVGVSPAAASGLRLLESAMLTSHWGGADQVAVVGRISNQTQEQLGTIQVEAQFRDAQGTLVDTATDSLYWRSAGAMPGQERAFRVEVQPDLPLGSYASCKVFVRSARRPESF